MCKLDIVDYQEMRGLDCNRNQAQGIRNGPLAIPGQKRVYKALFKRREIECIVSFTLPLSHVSLFWIIFEVPSFFLLGSH